MFDHLKMFAVFSVLTLTLGSCTRESVNEDYIRAGMPRELIENGTMITIPQQ